MKNKKVLWVLGSVILTAIGFAVIPVFVEKYGNKLYKSLLKREEIDFDGMEPEVVKKTHRR